MHRKEEKGRGVWRKAIPWLGTAQKTINETTLRTEVSDEVSTVEKSLDVDGQIGVLSALSSGAENRQSDAERRDAEEQTDAQLQTTAYEKRHDDTGDAFIYCANHFDSFHVVVIKMLIFIENHQI